MSLWSILEMTKYAEEKHSQFLSKDSRGIRIIVSNKNNDESSVFGKILLLFSSEKLLLREKIKSHQTTTRDDLLIRLTTYHYLSVRTKKKNKSNRQTKLRFMHFAILHQFLKNF